MAKYQGHKSKPYWNVSLWINNDEGLYNLARHYIRVSANKDMAAKRMFEALTESGTGKTPDGYRYSKGAVRAAMVDM